MILRDIALKLANEDFMASEVKAIEGLREGRPARPSSAEVIREDLTCDAPGRCVSDDRFIAPATASKSVADCDA
jgi:hypothetical protein